MSASWPGSETAVAVSDTCEYRALYVHVPFCVSRCGYCDFVTEAVSPDDPCMDRYVAGLVEDIRTAGQEGLLAKVRTIYLGGGTPTFMGRRRLGELCACIVNTVPMDGVVEFTVEANPESLSEGMLGDLVDRGVNRLSLGVQSFVDAELEALGRAHDARQARLAVEMAVDALENVSLDLMCGVPGQDEASWHRSLEASLRSGVRHVSVYPLLVAEDTPFGRRIAQGSMAEVEDDLMAALMEQAAFELEGTGFSRYEVASYAREGYACRHNVAYWTGEPYVGLGRGAAAMRQTAQGRERIEDGVVVERLSPTEALWEDLMLGMRMSAGVLASAVHEAARINAEVLDVFKLLEEWGLVRLFEGRYRPTPRGWLMGNEIFWRIWESRPMK